MPKEISRRSTDPYLDEERTAFMRAVAYHPEIRFSEVIDRLILDYLNVKAQIEQVDDPETAHDLDKQFGVRMMAELESLNLGYDWAHEMVSDEILFAVEFPEKRTTYFSGRQVSTPPLLKWPEWPHWYIGVPKEEYKKRASEYFEAFITQHIEQYIEQRKAEWRGYEPKPIRERNTTFAQRLDYAALRVCEQWTWKQIEHYALSHDKVTVDERSLIDTVKPIFERIRPEYEDKPISWTPLDSPDKT